MTDEFEVDSATLPTALPIAGVVLANAAPDWASFTEDVNCPLCGYNLRGLPSAKCPECGAVFEWRDLLDPRRRYHAYLFEYHPDANLRSFVRTLKAGISPTWFWQSVHPVLPIRVGRLRLYLGLVVLAMFVSFVAGQFAIARMPAAGRWGPVFGGNEFLPWTWSFRDFIVVLDFNSYFLNFVVWLGATFGALLVFQSTMRRAKVRTAHVFRCVTYACDAYVWLAIVVVFLHGLTALGLPVLPILLQVIVAIVVGLMVMFRLLVAYEQYLQFPKSTETILLSQLIAGLAILNLHVLRIWLP